jgi:thiamine biosynthesis lipoprotein
VSAGRVRSVPVMGTIVSIDVVEGGAGDADGAERDAAVNRAFDWFREIERMCNRFDPDSELRRLTARPNTPVRVSDGLFALLEFALAVAEDTGGAFDPTVGRRMEARGFNRDYRTGEAIQPSGVPDDAVTYRDVHLDRANRTIAIERPLLLDLGAVAKGLAIDYAARALAPFEHFAIDAGGDLYLSGRNAAGEPWSVGIRHPQRDREAIEILRVSGAAVCTSGAYERPAPGGGGHHILDPRSGGSADEVASATVVAPHALLADALATAAFVMGPAEGIRLLERAQVEGVLFSRSLERFATPDLHQELDRG